MYVSVLCSLQEELKDFREMYEERQKNPEVRKMDSLLPAQKNLSVEFNKHRKELVSIQFNCMQFMEHLSIVKQIACFIFVITFFISAILMRHINSLSSLMFNC
jgi:hypothetical protein